MFESITTNLLESVNDRLVEGVLPRTKVNPIGTPKRLAVHRIISTKRRGVERAKRSGMQNRLGYRTTRSGILSRDVDTPTYSVRGRFQTSEGNRGRDTFRKFLKGSKKAEGDMHKHFTLSDNTRHSYDDSGFTRNTAAANVKQPHRVGILSPPSSSKSNWKAYQGLRKEQGGITRSKTESMKRYWDRIGFGRKKK